MIEKRSTRQTVQLISSGRMYEIYFCNRANWTDSSIGMLLHWLETVTN